MTARRNRSIAGKVCQWEKELQKTCLGLVMGTYGCVPREKRSQCILNRVRNLAAVKIRQSKYAKLKELRGEDTILAQCSMWRRMEEKLVEIRVEFRMTKKIVLEKKHVRRGLSLLGGKTKERT